MTDDERRRIENLFVRCGAGVSRYVLLRVGDAELAEEITARVFLGVVRNIHQQNGSLIAWLWSIVRTELSRHYRARPHCPIAKEPIAPDPLPFEQMLSEEADERLHAAVAQLEDEQQQLLSLKFFFDLSHQEIADAMGISVSNVGVRVHRAVNELRTMLREPTEAL
ncbi:MAG: sigma-70 family RNA polymerase sigma factor [Gemmataceae bacterium]|nr:sigma-70 family RNA polymerase sigma factor [Gemmataceae bacterium]